jgi:hypothetical protein
MDFIYEMSGPQLFSVVPVRCELDLMKHKTSCEVYAFTISGDRIREQASFWLDFDEAVYLSTGKNGYKPATADMLAFDPVLRRRSSSRTYHGAGVSTNLFFGSHFKRFGAVALRFEPVAIGLGQNWYAVFTVRRYRHAFTAEQFGRTTAAASANRKGEFVFGLNVEYRPF